MGRHRDRSAKTRTPLGGGAPLRHSSPTSILGVLAAAAFILLPFSGMTEAAETKPVTDWSFYVHTTYTGTLEDLGCNQSTFDSEHNTNSLVFLDFGGQQANGSGTLLTNGTSVSNGTVESLAEAFALGYYVCANTSTDLILAVGTNNSLYDVSYSGGQTWAHVVQAVQNGTDYRDVSIWGGNDLEPSYSYWSNASGWISGYAAVDPAFYLDYGSADKCSSTSSANGYCTNTWYQSDVYQAAWGAGPAQSAPEIYSLNDAAQWAEIAGYGRSIGSTMQFQGPLDEYDLATSTLTSSQAWSAFIGKLPSGTYMPYSLEVHNAS